MRWEGLDELQDALRNLPADLAREAAHIVESAANGAAATAKAEFHVRTGELRDHIVIEPLSVGAFGVGYVVKNTLWWAYVYEHGQQTPRQTSLGWNRGPMPAANIFIPTMMRKRRQMLNGLRELMERNGLLVTES